MERGPTASQLLDAWEQTRSQTPLQRAFSLLALAAPAHTAADLARYGVGRRDWELLALRERIFGSRMTATARCPACGQTIELDFDLADIRAELPPETDQWYAWQSGEHKVRFRLPTCGDLAELDARAQGRAGKIDLLQRCIAEVHVRGAARSTDGLPDEVVSAISGRMAELDPQGDVQLALSCPQCAQRWEAPLDIASYLWSEIHAWAGRTLEDVHRLAGAYGWRESDILALSPQRRQAYLELLLS